MKDTPLYLVMTKAGHLATVAIATIRTHTGVTVFAVEVVQGELEDLTEVSSWQALADPHPPYEVHEDDVPRLLLQISARLKAAREAADGCAPLD